MPCVVCKNTVQNVGVEGRRVFWCPRCGSLEEHHGESGKFSETPKLVAAVRGATDCARLQSADGLTLGVLIPVNVWRDVCEAVGREMPK